MVTATQQSYSLLRSGTFRNDSDTARALNIPALKEETSVNVSGGLVIKPIQNLWLTLDAFQIDINDRIVLSGSFRADALPALAQVGVNQAQVFTNVAQTRTRGIDIGAGYLYAFENESILNFKVAATWADTEVIGDVEAPGPILIGFEEVLFPERERSIIEEWQPNTRINLTADYIIGALKIGAASRYFGSYTVQAGSGERAQRQTYSGKWLADLQAVYQLNKSLTLTLGINNFLNQLTDLNEVGQARGGTLIDSTGTVIVDSPGVFTYDRAAAPFGFNGGLYYAKLSYRF